MKTEEDEAFDDLARRQGMWGGGFPAKRAMAADKVQDGKCKYCVDGCIACDARAQPAQEQEEDWGALAKKQLASIKRDTQASFEDAMVRATHKVMAEFEAQPAQEPVAHLWECLGKWSAYLVTNGKQADCAPPSWLVEAIQNATAPPKREWVGLTDEETQAYWDWEDWQTGAGRSTIFEMVKDIEAKLKRKNI